MNDASTEALVERLAASAQPVTPLAPPLRRSLVTLVALAVAGAAAIRILGDMDGLAARYSGREALMAAEMAAMLLTGVLAVTGAFILSIPGRSRRWLLAPLPTFALWLTLSGLGCYQDLVRLGPAGLGLGHGMNCLLFLLGSGLVVGLPLLLLLSRARPVDPLPVALLGGLGAAAFSALLLQFFHPPALTLIDLIAHVFAVLVVIAAAALSRRRTLAPA